LNQPAPAILRPSFDVSAALRRSLRSHEGDHTSSGKQVREFANAR
jgi:hypothetical protein